MSTLDIAGQLDANAVQTSVASVLGRQARAIDLLTRVTLGCVNVCDFCPTECKYTLEAECGKITRCAIDVSCVPETECCEPRGPCDCCCKKTRRCFTVNLNTCKPCHCRCRDDENMVSPSENKKIALTYCCKDCDCNDDCDGEVTVCLTNDCAPVTHDEHGNPVPCTWKIGKGQIKYICVVNGRITRIVN